MAKDMGKNQQMNQNVQAENLQTQNPNFQSSMSSNSDSMSANDNFRPVQGDPDAPSGTRFSTTDPHGRPVQGDPDAPSGTRFSTTDPHGRPVQGDPDAPSGTRFSTTDPHGRPVQGDPDAPSGTRFSTTDPHGRPVQGDPNAPAGPRENIDSMGAMESMDQSMSEAAGAETMSKTGTNAKGKGGGGAPGVFDSPAEVTQVGPAFANLYELRKQYKQGKINQSDYQQALNRAKAEIMASIISAPNQAVAGFAGLFGSAVGLVADFADKLSGDRGNISGAWYRTWGDIEGFFDKMADDAHDEAYTSILNNVYDEDCFKVNGVSVCDDDGGQNYSGDPHIGSGNSSGDSGRGMDPNGPVGQNEFGKKVGAWMLETGQMPSLGGNPNGHGKSSQQQRLDAYLAYTAASVFERGENDFKFNNGLMDVEIDQSRLDQLAEKLGNHGKIDTGGDMYGHGPSNSKNNLEKLEESLNDRMENAHDLGGSGNKVDDGVMDRLDEMFADHDRLGNRFDDRLNMDDKFDNRHDFDHRVDIEDFRPGLGEKPEFRPDLDNRPPVFDPALDNKPDFEEKPIVDEKPIAPVNPDAPDSAGESAPAGDIPEGTGIWSGPHFKDPPPEDPPEAPPADSAGQADGSGVAVKPRPGKRPRWPIFAAAGAAVAVIGGVIIGDRLPANPKTCEHTWAVVETVEAKCETDGYVISVCGDCEEEKREDIKAAGHSWEQSEQEEATCEDNGYVISVCANCGEEQREEIETLGHQWEITEDIEVTCETEGKVEQTCSVCGETKTEEVGALGHKWEETEHTDATCETGGKTVTTCSVCGASETEESEAIGHNWQVTATIERNCVTQGHKQYACSNCGATKDDDWSGYGAHKWVVDHKDATCTEEGHDNKRCSVCGATENSTIAAPGHSWVSDGDPATCTKAGSDHKRCSVCGAEEGGTVAALGHDYVNNVCTRCGDRRIIYVPDYTPNNRPSGGNNNNNNNNGGGGVVIFPGTIGPTTNGQLP